MANAKEKNKKDYKIEISDWLQYLEHESGISSSHLLSFRSRSFVGLAILLSMTFIVLSFGKGYSFLGFELSIIFIFAVLIASVVVFTGGWFNSDSKHAKIRDSAEKLLIEILLEHKYQTPQEIENKWKAELDRIDKRK